MSGLRQGHRGQAARASQRAVALEEMGRHGTPVARDRGAMTLLGALAVLLGSGALALLLARAPRLALGVGAAGAAAASVLGLIPTFELLLGGAAPGALSFDRQVPGGRLVLGLDVLSAFSRRCPRSTPATVRATSATTGAAPAPRRVSGTSSSRAWSSCSRRVPRSRSSSHGRS